MRKILLGALMLIFTAGSLAPAALAFECDLFLSTAKTLEMTDMSGDMPCHEPSDGTDHCDGLCLCLSLSLSQHQLIPEVVSPTEHAIISEVYSSPITYAHSIPKIPLYRPPITLA